jgi:transposase
LLNKPLTGRPSRLSDEQKAELKEIVSKSPEEAGFDTGTWNSSLINQLIHEKFREDFSLNNIQYILKKLGFSFKLPQKKTEEQPQQSSRNGWNINFPG